MSFIKHEILQPVRHFNMHDDPLTNIETLHLVLWDKGICIAGYDGTGAVLTTKVYTHAAHDIAAVESVFINEPLVAGPQPITHIWIADERNIVIPQHLYEQQAAEQWLRSFHFIETEERIQATGIQQHLQATVVYPVQEKLITLFHKYFAEAKIDAVSGMVLCQENGSERDTADIILLDTKAILTLRQKGALLSHQVTEITDIHNLVYTIGLMCQQHGIATEELHVALSGLCITEETAATLKSFFPRITVPGSEQFSSFTLLSKLISCAS